MFWSFLKKYRIYIFYSIIIIALFAIMLILKLPCPIKHITGVSCAGCGMTRAFTAAIHLDLVSAFHYHPLWITVLPIIAALIILYKKNKMQAYNLILYCTAILFLGVWVFRLASSSDIVTIDFDNSAISRTIHNITELF